MSDLARLSTTCGVYHVSGSELSHKSKTTEEHRAEHPVKSVEGNPRFLQFRTDFEYGKEKTLRACQAPSSLSESVSEWGNPFIKGIRCHVLA